MALTATTELEAVNQMLRVIGESPASSLDSLPDDAIAARTVLSSVSRQVQTEGWHFNTDVNYPLVASSAAPYEIAIPHTAVKVDPDDRLLDYVVRNGKLYDRANHTFSFEGKTVRCTVVWLFDFNQLPEALRQYVTVRAAREFADNVVGSAEINQITEEDEVRARMTWEAADLRQGDYNMLIGSYSVSKILVRGPGGGSIA